MANAGAVSMAGSESRAKRWKPFLILGGLIMALSAEVAVISHYSGQNPGASMKAVMVQGMGKSQQKASTKPDLERDEDLTNRKDQASIQSNVLNPVESAFSSEDEKARAQQFGVTQ